ncbi:MAG: PHP domain-containing protein [Thermoprotei archaeon]|nr:PHP domain-containing protein [Thermoprotei archaeon]
MYPRIDLHMHTRHSDGRNTIEEMIRAAEANDLEVIAITDHIFCPIKRPTWLDTAIREVNKAKENASLKVLLGVEITRPSIRDLTKKFPLPASIEHIVCEHPIPSGIKDKKVFLREVIEGIRHIASNDQVNVLAHPLNLGRSGVIGNFKDISKDVLEEVARILADSHVVMEIMSQMYWWYPYMDISTFTEAYTEFIRICKHHGVIFTIGSDAHSVCGVGNTYWSIKVLSRAGVTPDEIWIPDEGLRL